MVALGTLCVAYQWVRRKVSGMTVHDLADIDRVLDTDARHKGRNIFGDERTVD